MKIDNSNQVSIHKVRTMKNICTLLLLALLGSGTLGCSMCCGPYDFDYPTFGGKHPRANRSYGRVGSIFSDPNAMGPTASADSNLEAPTPLRSSEPDELEDDEDSSDNLRKFQEELDSLKSKSNDDLEELPSPDDADSDAKSATERRPMALVFH
jgi:hypothetical protein